MILIGLLRKAILLGLKFDECPKCHEPGAHMLARMTYWFTIFRVPIVLLWIRHGVLCPNCGTWEWVSFLRMRRALQTGLLPLKRERPGFREVVRQQFGAEEEGDLAALGLPVGANKADIRAAYVDLAKQVHPDHGGDTAAFAALHASYERLMIAADNDLRPEDTDPGPIFDRIEKNPHQGPFGWYVKLWPVLVVALLVIGAVSGKSSPSTTMSPPFSYPTAQSLLGDAHTCWLSASGEIVACRSKGGATMLFGTPQLTLSHTCYFVEPLLEGQSAMCR
jgi:hypothetical protein